MKQRWPLFTVALSALLVICLLPTHHSDSLYTLERSVHLRPDSTLVTIDRTPPRVDVRAKLKPHNGSLVLDSVIDRDTLYVQVTEDSTIEIRLHPAPRLTPEWIQYLRRDSLITERVCEFVSRPWYDSPLLVLAGAVLGFLAAILF